MNHFQRKRGILDAEVDGSTAFLARRRGEQARPPGRSFGKGGEIGKAREIG